MKTSFQETLAKLHHGLIVSCQVAPGDPLDQPEMIAAMAAAAEAGGALGIRANGQENIRAIRAAVSLPIIAINKRDYPGYDVYITPTFADAEEVVKAGGDIVAIDATSRPRPGGETVSNLVKRIREQLEVAVMADVSTVQEGLEAAQAGADLVATTLAGYTPYSRQTDGPDFTLLDVLVKQCPVPVVVEGRVWTPSQALEALRRGAYAVVVGTAITNPTMITRRFVEAMQ